jgi:hypothetical protein
LPGLRKTRSKIMSEKQKIDRRCFIKKSAKYIAGTTLIASAGSKSIGYGRPSKKHLSLKIKNPDAQVIDAHMPAPKGFSNEFPPSVVTAGGRRHIFVSCGRAVAIEIPVDTHILHDPKCTTRSPAIWAIGGFDAEITYGRFPLFTEYDRRTMYWRKNYCGTFNVDLMKEDSNHPEWVFSINHCESKNEIEKREYGTFSFHNSINLNDPATPETSSGIKANGRYRDYQAGYFGFVSMSYAPITAETKWGAELYHNDMGPVMWPQMGFMTPDGKQVHPDYKHPHSHPSSLIAEDPKDGRKYLYVFANISSTQQGKNNMVGAARSPIESRGMPGTYLNFYKGEYTEPSLPEDMSEDVDVLIRQRGGKADAIHPELHNINRFFAARLKRSGLFLSVESYYQQEFIETALRLSEDLRNWSDRFVVPNTRINRRTRSRNKPPFGLFYPKFLSADGSNHYEIDESEPFYIIAAKPHGLSYRQLSIEIL